MASLIMLRRILIPFDTRLSYSTCRYGNSSPPSMRGPAIPVAAQFSLFCDNYFKKLFKLRKGAIAFHFTAVLGCFGSSGAAELPADFVRLSELNPAIVLDIRYAGAGNVTGHPLTGYQAAECILRRDAADALLKVEMALRQQGRALVVYDCYRPPGAVADLVAWAQQGGSQTGLSHPRIGRDHLLRLGYIARRSLHSTGLAIDVGLIDPLRPIAPATSASCQESVAGSDGPAIVMGTSFDCFDPRSSTWSAKISPAAAANRAVLVKAMAAQGFANYAREWWHFTYRDAARAPPQSFPVVGPHP